MPHPTHRNRWPDVQEYLNQAIESDKGIRIRVPSKAAGHSLKMKVFGKKKDWRMNYIEIFKDDPANEAIRKDPHQLIQPDVLQDADGNWYLYLRKDNPYASGIILDVEEL